MKDLLLKVDWSSVLIVIVCVASLVATVWLDETVKVWRKKRASPFPLFKLTDEEGDTLSRIYSKEWITSPLCWQLDKDGSHPDLKDKIRKSIKGCCLMTHWLLEHRTSFASQYLYGSLSHIELRKQWIVTLLEYNNYHALVEKLK